MHRVRPVVLRPARVALRRGGPGRAPASHAEGDGDEAAWESLHSTRSRPFPVPSTGRIAVKAINDDGDEVLTVLPVS